jgi:hypothetical protein
MVPRMMLDLTPYLRYLSGVRRSRGEVTSPPCPRTHRAPYSNTAAILASTRRSGQRLNTLVNRDAPISQ